MKPRHWCQDYTHLKRDQKNWLPQLLQAILFVLFIVLLVGLGGTVAP
jgi:hypothetical protein